MFETNYENTGNLLPEGDYECIILGAFLNATKGGTEYFSVRLAVRNDVPQRFQNKNIFHSIWRRKPENRTADDNKVDGFSFKQMMNLCQKSGLPSGKSYKDLNELGKDLVGKCVRVTIEHTEYKGNIQESVKWISETRFPDCKHQQKKPEPAVTAPGVPAEDDGDLPF